MGIQSATVRHRWGRVWAALGPECQKPRHGLVRLNLKLVRGDVKPVTEFLAAPPFVSRHISPLVDHVQIFAELSQDQRVGDRRRLQAYSPGAEAPPASPCCRSQSWRSDGAMSLARPACVAAL